MRGRKEDDLSDERICEKDIAESPAVEFAPFTILSTCKGGGYTYCRTSPPHPKANLKGLYPLHRVVLENKIGRFLLDGEQSHHIDGDKFNNHPDNLECLTASEHTRLHKQKSEYFLIDCAACGKPFMITPREARLRLNRNVSKRLFCSRICGRHFSE